MAQPARSDSAAGHQRFVVERYAPGLTLEAVSMDERRVRRAAAAMTRAGRPVRYVGSIVIAAEETAFSVFEADDAESVAEANRRASVSFDRVVPIVELREPERSVLAPSLIGRRHVRAAVPGKEAS
jgi:hypothetical protein